MKGRPPSPPTPHKLESSDSPLVFTDAFHESGADLTDRTWAYGLGISYTGWDDFSLSMETTMNVLERRGQEDDFEAFLLTFNLRYWPH